MIALVDKAYLEAIDEMAVRVIQKMKSDQIPQWDFDYPRKVHFVPDIEDKVLYGYFIENTLCAVMAIRPQNDPPYEELDTWFFPESMVIHRVFVDPIMRGKKIAQQLLDFAEKKACESGYQSMKIDTHEKNYKMKQFLEKNGYIEKGYLTSIDRIAYEKILTCL